MARKRKDAEEAPAEPTCLTYVGGGRFIIGVPAKDLCMVPAEEAERLVSTGLYERAECATGAEAPPGD